MDEKLLKKLVEEYIKLQTEGGNESLEHKAYTAGIIKGFESYVIQRLYSP